MRGWKATTSWMRVLLVAVLCVALTPTFARDAEAQSSGFRIEAGRLVDSNGNDFVMRGINHPHGWFRDETASFADIKATGANTVRLVMSSGHRAEWTSTDEVAMLIDECKAHQLVCVLMVHDTTGFGEAGNAISLDRAVDYWVGVADALRGEQAHVIINIGNEPFGNTNHDDWAEATSQAVAKMRAADLDHTLMVDAPNWGQDWSHTMRDQAATVFEDDPNRNLIFDVHMFGVYEDERVVRSYMESFVRQKLPLVVGEFGPSHPSGDVDVDAVMHWAETYGLGHLAWSWSGNTVPVADLNLVADFDPDALTSWGERFVRGSDGIRATAVEASVFGRTVVQPRSFSRAVLPRPASDVPAVFLDRSEAEDGVLNGLGISVQGAGFEGNAYVNGLDTGGDSIAVQLHVEHDGVYDLVFGYRARFGEKTQQLYIDGVAAGPVVFPATNEFERLTVSGVRLSSGFNSVMIVHDWGWVEYDYLEVWSPPAFS